MITSEQFSAFQKGDRMEFKKIFDTFYKGLFLFAQKYIAECDVVEDIVQEIFIKLWEKRDTIENTSAVKAFLYIGVKNKALNYFRHQKIVQKYQKEMIQLKSQESFFKNHLIEEETYRLLLQSIKQLPEQTRKVCILSMNGVKNAQIAEQLDISTSTVKYHKKQAITILQGKLKDHLYLIPIIIRLMGL